MRTSPYDLLIIGNTPEARYGAKVAAQQRARVALITQGQTCVDLGLLSQSAQHQTQATGTFDPAHSSIAAAQESLSSYALAIAGVDEITSPGFLIVEPEPQWQTETEKLSAPRLILATGTVIQPPAITQNLNPFTTVTDLLTQPWAELPEQLIMVGASPTAIAIAQSLQRIGKQVTLVCRDRLLPQEDLAVVQRLQAVLEAAGIHIYTHTTITQIEQQGEQHVLHADALELVGDRAIWAEDIVPQRLGLPPDFQVCVNSSLQSLHRPHPTLSQRERASHSLLPSPQIYACGSLLGGYDHPHLGYGEAAIAVQNCLQRGIFSRQQRVDYQTIPWVLGTDPPLARVGLTLRQARRRYGDDVQVHHRDRRLLAHTHITETYTGYSHILTTAQGQILGATLFGPGADTLISAIALAIQQQLHLDQLAKIDHGRIM